MKEVVGVCLGASSVSFVRLARSSDEISITGSLHLAHNGDPKNLFLSKLKEFNPENLPVVATGRKFRHLVNYTKISEPEATELAFKFVTSKEDKYTAIASLGGETFMVYTLNEEGRISNVISKNQCASGTGEFFLQQIKRMDLTTNEITELASDAEPHKVSGRCSVFCKSDCTHALNKGVDKAEVASGLALMMAEKVEELLKKASEEKVLLVGGVTKNQLVMDFLKKSIDRVVIPEEAEYFEALGAALYGLENDVMTFDSFDGIFSDKESSFSFLDPLKKFEDKVVFKEMETDTAREGDRCILGLDVGSTTTKAVLIRENDNKILASIYLYTHGNPIKAARACYGELLKQLNVNIEIIGVGTTGSGRHIAGIHAMTEGVINEIVAHATAAVYFDPEVDTIFEIGGQDAKYTYIVNKVPADYAMNEACSAGTGSFIEEAAYESMGLKVTEIEQIALRGNHPPNFNDQCAAFINCDIKTALQENLNISDVVAGLTYSICINYVNRVKGNRPVGRKIFMQGGVCYNKAIPIAMAALTGNEIVVPPEPGLMGAFGVALEVKEKISLGIIEERKYDLSELAEREVTYKEPFICRGGKEKCDLACSINLIEVSGQKFPFGGACNRYYNIKQNSGVDTDKFDFVKKRQQLYFEKYAPKADLPEDAPTIGINNSFHTHTLYPLFYNFFTQLGFRIVLSEKVEDEGLDREATSFCFPCQLSLGLFQDLMNKGADYYFVPEIIEMYTDESEYQRIDFNCTCAFLNSEPLFLRQAFKDVLDWDKLIMPDLNFANGYDKEIEKFVEVARKIGINDAERAREAYRYGLKMLDDCVEEMYSTGNEFLDYLDRNPEQMAIVLMGRSYNSFTETANKGIPRKFASRGVYVLPFDMLDYRLESIDDNQYWEGSKKILRASKIVKRNKQLFATYISNFSCAPDSLTITTFRSLMGTKPSLTLELDGHTADAGINTRIDAALDIINNYRKIQDTVDDDVDEDFMPAEIIFDGKMNKFKTSDGDLVPLNDPNVEIIVPSMGDLSAKLFAAGLRSAGFNAIAAEPGSAEIIKYGRAHATGKECLPLLLIVGSMIDYIKNKWDGKKYAAFFVIQGAGNCRVGQYPVFMRDLVRRQKIRNFTPLALSNEDAFAGMGPKFDIRAVQSILAADVLEDVRSAIYANAVDPVEGEKIFDEEFEKLEKVLESDPDKLYNALKKFAKVIKQKVPARVKIEDSKFISIVGEIYVRREHYSHKWLNKRFAEHGFVVKDAHITEWLFYVDYLIDIGLLEPEEDKKKNKDRLIRKAYMRYAEHRIKKILAKTGYFEFHRIDVDPLLQTSKHIIPLEFKGEPGITLGVGLHETIEKYSGVVNLGPFGCMPTRFAEAVSVPEMKIENKIAAMRQIKPDYKLPTIFNGKMDIPFLTIETDGNVYPQVIEARLENFIMQCERTAELISKWKSNGS